MQLQIAMNIYSMILWCNAYSPYTVLRNIQMFMTELPY